VSPASALILGLVSGPLFAFAEGRFSRLRWLSDPVGLLPGHLVGGLFGVVMIPFFAQTAFATGSGYPSLPNGLFFGGGMAAVHQLGVEVLGILAVVAFVFVVSFTVVAVIARVSHGITTSPEEQAEVGAAPAASPTS
jgi:ammonium transporter, Amt family